MVTGIEVKMEKIIGYSVLCVSLLLTGCIPAPESNLPVDSNQPTLQLQTPDPTAVSDVLTTIPEDCILMDVSSDRQWFAIECPHSDIQVKGSNEDQWLSIEIPEGINTDSPGVAFSPDSSKMVVSFIRGPILLYDLSGPLTPTILHQPGGAHGMPVWSPDGGYLICPELQDGYAMSKLSLDGSLESLLTTEEINPSPYVLNNYGPIWDPSGEYFLYGVRQVVDSQERYAWWRYDLESKNHAPIDVFSRPFISPDGEKIAYMENGYLYLMDAQTLQELPLSPIKLNLTEADTDLTLFFSEDGDYSAIVSQSSQSMRVVNLQSAEISHYSVRGYEVLGWSSDDRLIIFVRDLSEVRYFTLFP